MIILASASPRRQELLQAVGLSFIVVRPFLPAAPDAPQGHQQEVDETPLPGEAPQALVQRLSRTKAEAVAASLPLLASTLGRCSENRPPTADRRPPESIIIIAADTVVVFNDKILGKPANAAEATQMLKQLRSHCHCVYSGLTVGVVSNQNLEVSNQGSGVRDQFTPSAPCSPAPLLPCSHLVTRLHQSRVWMRSYTDAEIAAYVASGDPLDKAGAYAIQNQSFAPVERLEGCFASVMGLPLAELAAVFQAIGLSLPESGPLCTRYTGYLCCQNNL